MAVATETPTWPVPGPGRGAAKRVAILDRAVDLASVEGLEGLTIGRLATELEMSKSGLFAHFGSKQELQLVTVDCRGAALLGCGCRAGPSADEGLPRLRALAKSSLAYLDDGTFSGGCFWAAASAEYDDRPGPVRDAIAAGLDAWLGELARQAKIARSAEPDRFAFELYAIATGANARFRLSGDRAVFAFARSAIDRLLGELPG